MSGEKATSPCNKFQANIFNKSKCQNCFKSRQLHLLNDHDMEQAKPIYAGWLCLAPVGTDFNNPLQRSRKWQRRFFILYEHGSLSFALDELPSTLPQGTVNMNLCTDLTDAEPRTGQKNALCIVTSEQQIFIRGENREIINGWTEQLGVYLRPNKHTLKKKRKVDTAASPEPSPAKMAATCPSSDDSKSICGQWQEVQQGADVTPAWTAPDSDASSEPPPAGLAASHVSPAFEESPGFSDGSADPGRVQQLTEPGPNKLQTPANNGDTSQSRREAVPSVKSLNRTEKENEGTAANRTGRTNKREKLQSCGDIAQLAAPPLPQRRARSLDRRTSDTAMTPDLLNFKKGWMVKLDENNQWMKYWFVLSTNSLKYYKDSMAEEASDLEGEMDLRLCYNVSEYQVQRNYGFQIHTLNGVHTLSAMTAGIRKNWIQALMKNVHPAYTPDVSSVPGLPLLSSPPEVLPKPDLTQDSPEVCTERRKSKSITERRREGRYRTFDWADFRSQTKPDPADAHRTPPLSALELGDLARRTRREERRKRYESMLGFSLDRDGTGGGPLSPTSRQKAEEDMERCWRQVEKTMFRLDRTVPIICDRKEPEETVLDGFRTRIEELNAQLSESELRRLELEAELNSTKGCSLLNSPFLNKADFNALDENTLTARLFDKTNEEETEQEQLRSPQTPRICLHDPDGNVKEITRSLSPLMSAAPDSSSLSPTEEGLKPETQELPRDLLTRDSDVPPDGVEKQTSPDSHLLERLSQEVELLTNQNQALHRHNQEMLNQLTEADREIERLKDELRGKSEDTVHLSEEERPGPTRLENLERELDMKKQQLTEAQRLISLLEDSVRETEALLVQTERKQTRKDDARSEKNQGYLLRCFEATEARLNELTKKLEQSEAAREELLEQNTELRQTERVYRLKAAEAGADVTKVRGQLENEKQQQKGLCQEQTQNVKEGFTMRFRTLEKLLEMAQKLDLSAIKRQRVCERPGMESVIMTGLKWEESFWSLLLTELKMNEEEEPLKELLCELTEHMIAEKHMIVSGVDMSRDVEENDSNAAREINGINETNRSETFDVNEKLFDKEKSLMEHCKARAQMQLLGLSNIDLSLNDYERFVKFSAHPWFSFIHSAAVEALCCCHMSSLQSVYRKELEEAKEKLSSALNCSRCRELTEENERLKESFLTLEDTFASSLGQKVDVCCQTETCVEISSKRQDRREENVSSEESKVQNGAVEAKYMEISGAEDEKEVETLQTSHEPDAETEQSVVSSEEFELRSRVKELEELLHVSQEKQKHELELKMSSVEVRHGQEVDKLKATCERAFSSMEESHVKVVEELQHRHRRELQRLLVERDRLLEEESAATATAIEAIKKAHRLELEREVQRRAQSQSSSPDLQDIYTQHSEELASSQRQLQVLSQQFSLKCLENGHLVQALDAERKALCQCQQENQDLRTKNQELSGHLVAEITRLCSLSRQNALPFTQGMDLFELEITLRVKESEVQCLKQELTSLKEELQSAQRDERKALKQYKEVLTELSLSRARWERDVEELRENLRLLHQALDQTSL